MHKVFVYGTLRRGEENAHYLRGAEAISLAAVAVGRLVDTGRGYPALVPDHDPGRKVIGELYVVDADRLVTLDELEDYYGSGDSRNEYDRIMASVETEWGTAEAWIYVYAQPEDLSGGMTIEDGDWAQYRRSRMPGRSPNAAR